VKPSDRREIQISVRGFLFEKKLIKRKVIERERRKRDWGLGIRKKFVL